jgi:hypothetical protein
MAPRDEVVAPRDEVACGDNGGDKKNPKNLGFRAFIEPSDQNQLYHISLLIQNPPTPYPPLWDKIPKSAGKKKKKKIVGSPILPQFQII